MISNSIKRTRRGAMVPLVALLALAAGTVGCSPRPAEQAAPAAHRHEHHAPHGGTAIVLGDEAYHVELVIDAAAGGVQAYILDGELENFVRVAMPSIELVARFGGERRVLVLTAVANPATGETIGDTSLFEAHADWLKATPKFTGVFTQITIRGTTFSGVSFDFPHGNEAH